MNVTLRDVHGATASYEAWLRTHVRVRDADLELKHRKMKEDAFVFLRATFYRWLERWRQQDDDLLEAPRVAAVGDLHVENFGTWRDAEGRLVWGINDVDEACRLPYTHDLVRLASSALLARAAGQMRTAPEATCRLVLDGYTESLERGGNPIVLAEDRRWLRAVAQKEMDDPKEFWEEIEQLDKATERVPSKEFRVSLPRGTSPTYHVRVSGVGSLGRPRFVALATWDGGYVAREAKARVPSAAAWLGGGGGPVDGAAVLHRAARAEDPFYRSTPRWSIRRLAPDCTKIELSDLPEQQDEEKLLKAMGWETGNLHAASRRSKEILKDLKRRKPVWLARTAEGMASAATDDWQAWRDAP